MRLLEGRALTQLAHAQLELGELERAARTAERAVRVSRERKQRLHEARALIVLGLVRRAGGDARAARPLWQAAWDIVSVIGAPEAQEVRELLDTGAPPLI